MKVDQKRVSPKPFQTVYQSRDHEVFETLFSIHFHLYEVEQKPVYEEYEGRPKLRFDHVINDFDLSPPKLWTGLKMDPRVFDFCAGD